MLVFTYKCSHLRAPARNNVGMHAPFQGRTNKEMKENKSPRQCMRAYVCPYLYQCMHAHVSRDTRVWYTYVYAYPYCIEREQRRRLQSSSSSSSLARRSHVSVPMYMCRRPSYRCLRAWGTCLVCFYCGQGTVWQKRVSSSSCLCLLKGEGFVSSHAKIGCRGSFTKKSARRE